MLCSLQLALSACAYALQEFQLRPLPSHAGLPSLAGGVDKLDARQRAAFVGSLRVYRAAEALDMLMSVAQHSEHEGCSPEFVKHALVRENIEVSNVLYPPQNYTSSHPEVRRLYAEFEAAGGTAKLASDLQQLDANITRSGMSPVAYLTRHGPNPCVPIVQGWHLMPGFRHIKCSITHM